MNKQVLFFGLIVILIGVGIFFQYRSEPQQGTAEVSSQSLDQEARSDADTRQYSVARDAVLGYEFTYVNGPDGYITLEDNESMDPDFFSGIMLMDWQEHEMLQASTDAREGPPSMHVRIYNNSENLHAPVWAMRHAAEVNYGLKIGAEEESVVGGANATHFIADGLYPIDTYVVASGQHVYVLMGSYREPDDEIHRDFEDLVRSFTFINNEVGPQGKIDPRVACEHALTYMLFESGDATEQFLAECEAGEHPEVLEQYIQTLDVPGAAI